MKPIDTETPMSCLLSQLENGGTDALDSVDGGTAGDPQWSIGELALQLGVSTRTIRFYEARNLIMPGRDKGARIYGRRDRARLQIILRGKNLGFTLDDIHQYLALYDADHNQVTQTQLLLRKVESAIDGLERKKVDLERTLTELRELRARATEFLGAPIQDEL